MPHSASRLSIELNEPHGRLDVPAHGAPPHLFGADDDTVVSDYTALLSGSWNVTFGQPAFVTYSFETAAQPYLASDGFSSSFTNTFQAFTATEEANARAALAQWGDASGITFLEAPAGEGDIKFAKYDFDTDPSVSDAAGFSYIPYFDLNAQDYQDDALWGDVFINTTDSPGSADDATLFYLLHEIGHAIGFKHPFEDEPILAKNLDNTTHTVMSYTGGVVSHLGDLDLAAVLYAYGSNSLDGTEVPQWNWSAATHTLTQTGGVGNDVIKGVSAEDFINGGDGDNIIYGGDGNDTLIQSLGHDTIFAGNGNDRLTMSGGTDVFDAGDGNDTLAVTAGSGSFHGGAGNDVVTKASADLAAIQVFGDDGNDIISSGSSPDTINGGAGNDTISIGSNTADVDGWTGDDSIRVGNDTKSIVGNFGNDTIIAGDGAQSISGGWGDDTIIAGINAGFIQGGEGSDTIRAGLGARAILGGEGNDVIYAHGGTSVDAGNGYDAIYADLNNLPLGTITRLRGGATAFFLDGSTIGVIITDTGSNQDSVFSTQSIDLSYQGGLSSITLTGTAASAAKGNDINNVIKGNSASNFLQGLGGSDTLEGGGGHDTLKGGDGIDYASYASSGHGMAAHLGDAATLGGDPGGAIFVGIEGLIGSNFGDTLTGGSGNDSLIGGAGADRLIGGAGTDIVSYADSMVPIKANLAAGRGVGGTAEGDSYQSIEGITGSSFNDILTGSAGDDVLTDGTSIYGNGRDLMIGGAGNDAYYVYTPSRVVELEGDTVREAAGGGSDTVYVNSLFVLAAGSSVEVLQFVSPGPGEHVLVGNELAQTLIGSSSHDELNGGGGGDTLIGGDGSDGYVVHSQSDHIVEAANGGIDGVIALASYTLESGQSIEEMQGESLNGLRLQGNTLTQTIGGFSGDDTLAGGGGPDTLLGESGNDICIVDDARVVVRETQGFGTDTVFASVSYALSPGQSIDILGTTSVAGAASINLTGNDLGQKINGNAGINVLTGGDGVDTLTGFGGDDTLFGLRGNDHVSGGAGRDRIDPGYGSDVLVYASVSESTGVARDLAINLNFNNADHFQFTVKPVAIDAELTHGDLSGAQFDQNMAAAVGAGQLAARHAMLFDPDGGDLNQAGHVYLVVDANGVAGYQAGQDYVVELVNFSSTLTLDDFV